MNLLLSQAHVTAYKSTETQLSVKWKPLHQLRSSIFCDTLFCSPLKLNRRFEGKFYRHLQDQNISQARNRHEDG